MPPYDVGLGPNMRPVVQLLDESLSPLVTREATASGQPVSVSAPLPAGRYYVRVSNGNGARSPGTYSITRSTRRLYRVSPLVEGP